jgi:ribosomal protein S12 methylthiotransferase accessory factor
MSGLSEKRAWYASAFTGLFQRFGPLEARAHDPALALYSGTAAAWSGPAPHLEASGIGWDAASAEAACVGEAVERLQAHVLPDDRVITASYADWPLDDPAVAPEKWVLFHPEQYAQAGFPYRPLTRTTVCRWVCCRRWPEGEPCWPPEEMVYLDLRVGERHGLCPSVSTGLACGRWGDRVLLRGLQEVIERDAVVGAWWGRYALEEASFPRVLCLLAAERAERVSRPNLRYRAFRIDSPFSRHVTLVTVQGEDREGPCFSIGSACRETRRASWEKAVLEAVHGRHFVRYLKNLIRAGEGSPSPLPRSFAEHAVYYSLFPEKLTQTVLASPKVAGESFGDSVHEDVACLAERLGPERPILFRLMTPPALAQQGLDWYVLRVVVPGLQPLHGHHAYAHLGGPLWRPRGLAEWSMMPPHPFP